MEILSTNPYALKDKHKKLNYNFKVPKTKKLDPERVKYIEDLAVKRKTNDKKRSIEALGGIRIDDLPKDIDLRC